MTATYAEFLAAKAQANTASGFEPLWMPDFLFGFQKEMTSWAIRKGRGALHQDCGLGKTPQLLVWAENVRRKTGRPTLVVTPLAVSFQIAREAAKFDVDAACSRDGRPGAGITITNYERLERFESGDYGGVVCDESSAIKAFDGRRRALVTEFLRPHRYRLLCTATAAPNDYLELGTSSEALGYLGHSDMLSRFFAADRNFVRIGGNWSGAKWRFRGHAEQPFWAWVASWARAMRRPSDLGFSDDGFVLPPLEYRQAVVRARTPPSGSLFDLPASGLQEEREELRRTLTERCEAAGGILADAAPGIAWCHLNAESTLLVRLIDGAVEVSGSDPLEVKEEKLAAFADGQVRVLVTKPTVAAHGLNWQHCHRMTYFPSHSYELWYQAVRRCWRFGQQSPVTVDIVTTVGGRNALTNLQRKAEQANRMFDALVLHMRDALAVRRAEVHSRPVEVPPWAC